MNPFERIKVCLLNKRDIPFFDTKINWAQLENFYFTFFFMDFTKKNRLFLLYSGTYSRLMRGFVIAAQDASALHNK
jgi:hypothetical protein